MNIDATAVKEAARNRWPEILRSLAPEFSETIDAGPNQKVQQFRPACIWCELATSNNGKLSPILTATLKERSKAMNAKVVKRKKPLMAVFVGGPKDGEHDIFRANNTAIHDEPTAGSIMLLPDDDEAGTFVHRYQYNGEGIANYLLPEANEDEQQLANVRFALSQLQVNETEETRALASSLCSAFQAHRNTLAKLIQIRQATFARLNVGKLVGVHLGGVQIRGALLSASGEKCTVRIRDGVKLQDFPISNIYKIRDGVFDDGIPF